MNLLNKYSSSFKKKLCVATSASRKEKKFRVSLSDESYFFKNIAPNCKILESSPEEIAEKSKIIICMTSNLGLELIAKGHKVFFININNLFFDIPFKSENGPFWQKQFNKKIIIKKINKLLRMKKENYTKMVKKHFYLNEFDQENLKFKKLLNSILL